MPLTKLTKMKLVVLGGALVLLTSCSWRGSVEGEARVEIGAGQSVSTNALGMKFIEIKAGSFMAGWPATLPTAISESFEMQQTPVTQAQWFYVMGSAPSRFSDKAFCVNGFREFSDGRTICTDHPVESVTFREIEVFLERLNEIDSRFSHRLPTEAEFEFAASGGGQTGFPFDGGWNLADSIWSRENSGNGSTFGDGSPAGQTTKPVATTKKPVPGPYALYDMYGNVAHVLQDWLKKERAGGVNPSGPTTGLSKVVRGCGIWNTVRKDAGDSYFFCFSDKYGDGWNRDSIEVDSRSPMIGFRVVRTAR
jgi:formylglycine-generating enzyme required for sulfatase activity